MRRVPAWALSATMGGLLLGYNLGVIAGVLLFVRREFHLGDAEQGVLVGTLPFCAIAGGLLAGGLADALGRRTTLVLAGVTLAAAMTLAVLAPSYWVLVAARGGIGLAVGISSSTVPVYLSEMAAPEVRGRFIAMNQLMVTLGILTAFLVAVAFSGSGSWRAMLGVGLLPAAAFVIGMLRAPEPPSAARDEERTAGRARTLLLASARPALIVALVLAVAQQLSGINAIVSYAPSIMEKTGLGASDSILYSVVIGVVNVAATVVSFRLVDRVGRRPLLLASLGGMFVALVGLGLTFLLPAGAGQSWLSLACLLLYVAAFAVGMGPIFWVLIAEIFPPPARAAGASVATATNWLVNGTVGAGFLSVVTAIGEAATFWLFAAACALTFAFATRYVPETKGRTFDEIDDELRGRWGAAAPQAVER